MLPSLCYLLRLHSQRSNLQPHFCITVLFDQRLRTGPHRMHRQRAQQASYFQKMVILITLWRQAVAARQLASNPPRQQRSRTGMRVSRQIIVLRKWPAILARMMKLVASQGRRAAQARLARRRTSAWPTTMDVAFASQVLATAVQVTLKAILICSSGRRQVCPVVRCLVLVFAALTIAIEPATLTLASKMSGRQSISI